MKYAFSRDDSRAKAELTATTIGTTRVIQLTFAVPGAEVDQADELFGTLVRSLQLEGWSARLVEGLPTDADATLQQTRRPPRR